MRGLARDAERPRQLGERRAVLQRERDVRALEFVDLGPKLGQRAQGGGRFRCGDRLLEHRQVSFGVRGHTVDNAVTAKVG